MQRLKLLASTAIPDQPHQPQTSHQSAIPAQPNERPVSVAGRRPREQRVRRRPIQRGIDEDADADDRRPASEPQRLLGDAPYLLSRKAVARITGFTESTIIRWEQAGILRPIKIGGAGNSRVRYAMPEVLALMAKQQEGRQ